MKIGTLVIAGVGTAIVAYAVTRNPPETKPGATLPPDHTNPAPQVPANPTSAQDAAIDAVRKALLAGGCSPDIYPLIWAASQAGVQVLPADIVQALDVECPALYLGIEQDLSDVITDPSSLCDDWDKAIAMVRIIGATVVDSVIALRETLCGPVLVTGEIGNTGTGTPVPTTHPPIVDVSNVLGWDPTRAGVTLYQWDGMTWQVLFSARMSFQDWNALVAANFAGANVVLPGYRMQAPPYQMIRYFVSTPAGVWKRAADYPNYYIPPGP